MASQAAQAGARRALRSASPADRSRDWGVGIRDWGYGRMKSPALQGSDEGMQHPANRLGESRCLFGHLRLDEPPATEELNDRLDLGLGAERIHQMVQVPLGTSSMAFCDVRRN